MYKYEIVLNWDKEENTYMASVTELPGCIANGPSYMEALFNIEIVIVQWLEAAKKLGKEIPKPKTDTNPD